jgi:hypothetical protein
MMFANDSNNVEFANDTINSAENLNSFYGKIIGIW